MSNSHLFLKSGFPRAPLQNGLGRYVCQLQRITLKYCKSSGSSKGMRDFLETKLVDFARENPGVVVYVKPRRHRTAVIVGEYLNGDRHWMNCRDYSGDQISKWVEMLKNQNGNSAEMRYRKLWHTDCPSIQGVWTPFTHRNPSLNVAQLPDDNLSKPVDIEQSATEKLIEIFKKQQIEDSLDKNRAE